MRNLLTSFMSFLNLLKSSKIFQNLRFLCEIFYDIFMKPLNSLWNLSETLEVLIKSLRSGVPSKVEWSAPPTILTNYQIHLEWIRSGIINTIQLLYSKYWNNFLTFLTSVAVILSISATRDAGVTIRPFSKAWWLRFSNWVGEHSVAAKTDVFNAALPRQMSASVKLADFSHL